MDDVMMMCEKRKTSLRKLASRLPRPVHAVTPEPAVPLHYPSSTQYSSSTTSTHQSTTSLPHSHPSSPHHSGGETPKSPKSLRKSSTLPKVRFSFLLLKNILSILSAFGPNRDTQ